MKRTLHRIFLSERAVLRWGALGLAGAILSLLGPRLGLDWAKPVGTWMAIPFGVILAVSLLILLPYWWLQDRKRS